MMHESMCDSCMKPGHCCKRLYLSGGGRDDPTQKIDAPMSFERAEHLALKHGLWMMRPLEQQPTGEWNWSCTQLLPNGRCGIYETRPDLCRRYQPGQDGLCAHFWAADGEAVPL